MVATEQKIFLKSKHITMPTLNLHKWNWPKSYSNQNPNYICAFPIVKSFLWAKFTHLSLTPFPWKEIPKTFYEPTEAHILPQLFMAEHYKSFQKNSTDCTFQDPKFLVTLKTWQRIYSTLPDCFTVSRRGHPSQNCRRLERKRNRDKNQIELLQSSSAWLSSTMTNL